MITTKKEFMTRIFNETDYFSGKKWQQITTDENGAMSFIVNKGIVTITLDNLKVVDINKYNFMHYIEITENKLLLLQFDNYLNKVKVYEINKSIKELQLY